MQTYRIPSATTPGKAYTVIIHNDNVLSCDCPDATFRRRQCRHQRFVLAIYTPAGRSGALVAQHAAAQAMALTEATAHTLVSVGNPPGWVGDLYLATCSCGWSGNMADPDSARWLYDRHVTEAQQGAATDSEHGHGAYVDAVALCRCGWQSSPTIDALVELAEHVSAARLGERAAARAYLADSEADLGGVMRITRTI